jgi:hypothetical protein
VILRLFGCEAVRLSWYRRRAEVCADRLLVELAEERGRVLALKMELEELRKTQAQPVSSQALAHAVQTEWQWRRRRRLEWGSLEAGYQIQVSAPGLRPVVYWNSDMIEAVDLYCKVSGATFDSVSVELVPPIESAKP